MTSISSLKILIADDNKLSQIVLKKKLESAGATVDVADDGTGVMRYLDDQDYDLIILDMYMPEMDGRETLSAIRKLDSPAKRSIPVIACTASNMPGDELDTGDEAFQAITSKPVDFDQLLGIISRLTTNE